MGRTLIPWGALLPWGIPWKKQSPFNAPLDGYRVEYPMDDFIMYAMYPNGNPIG